VYVILWEYRVKADRVAEFERIYSGSGAWAELFKKGEGYLNTQLLRDEASPQHYLTVDRWTSSEHYVSFRSQWENEYASLDAGCEGLTEQEILLGKWESILPEIH
jgi:heme-degrading monooxygenase HmoA